MWFWLRVAHKIVIKMLDRAGIILKAQVGLEGPHPSWFTHMAGKLVVIFGKRLRGIGISIGLPESPYHTAVGFPQSE